VVVSVSSLQQNFTGSPKLKLQYILQVNEHFLGRKAGRHIICLINTRQDSRPAIKRTQFINITMASSLSMYSICSSVASPEEN
jgi:hypothetical protein